MTLTPEQVIAANKANLSSFYGLSQQAFSGVEKLVELNLTAARASLTESTEHAKAVLSAKDAQELLKNLVRKSSYVEKLPRDLKFGLVVKKMNDKQKLRNEGYLVYDLDDFTR